MSNDLQYTDEGIHRRVRQIKAEQKPAPAFDKLPTEAKPEEAPPHPAGIAQELSIEEILKKIEREISGKNSPA